MTGSRRLRVAVLASPVFALPVLETVHVRHDLRLVIAQGDKPAGRGLRERAPAAASWAREHGVPLLQPPRLKGNDALVEALRALELDVAVTAAYGKILPAALLAVPRHGVLNVHASLLPAYRGAAPIQWALIDGARETGVSIMQTETGLDTGPVRHVRRLAIRPVDDAVSLTTSLARLGAAALGEALEALAAGALPSVPQDDALATYAPRLTRDDGRVRWDEPAERVIDRHRGVVLWPGSWTTVRGAQLKIHDMALADDAAVGVGAPAGTILRVSAAGLHVATQRGVVSVREVQASGRARIAADAWARGARVGEGTSLA